MLRKPRMAGTSGADLQGLGGGCGSGGDAGTGSGCGAVADSGPGATAAVAADMYVLVVTAAATVASKSTGLGCLFGFGVSALVAAREWSVGELWGARRSGGGGGGGAGRAGGAGAGYRELGEAGAT